jgi:hypothetical protein
MRSLPRFFLLLLFSIPASAEWNVAAYLGGTRTHNSVITFEQPSQNTRVLFRDVSYSGQDFQKPLYYGIRGGYVFGRAFGLEAEFIHLKVFADTNRTVQVDGQVGNQGFNGPLPMNTLVQHFSISHGLNMLFGNIVLRRNFLVEEEENIGRILLNSRFGFGTTFPHPEIEALGFTQQGYQDGRPAFQTGTGLEVRLWKRVYGLGEYKFTFTRQKPTIPNGTAETILATHHILFGTALHF